MGYIGMCGPKGQGFFSLFAHKQGIDFSHFAAILVTNGLSTHKQGIKFLVRSLIAHKQGRENRLQATHKQGKGFGKRAAHPYLFLGGVPPPPPRRHLDLLRRADESRQTRDCCPRLQPPIYRVLLLKSHKNLLFLRSMNVFQSCFKFTQNAGIKIILHKNYCKGDVYITQTEMLKNVSFRFDFRKLHELVYCKKCFIQSCVQTL